MLHGRFIFLGHVQDVAVYGDSCACDSSKQKEMNYKQALLKVYGIPYDDWKANYQTKTNPEKLDIHISKNIS